MLGADVLTFLAPRAITFGDTRVPYQRRREAPGLLQRVGQRVHDGRRPRRLRCLRPKHDSLQSEPSGYDEVAIRHRHSHLRDRLRDDSHEPLVRPPHRNPQSFNLRRKSPPARQPPRRLWPSSVIPATRVHRGQCGDRQRAAQRRGPDAPSRTGVRSGDRQRRWARNSRVGCRGSCARRRGTSELILIRDASDRWTHGVGAEWGRCSSFLAYCWA